MFETGFQAKVYQHFQVYHVQLLPLCKPQADLSLLTTCLYSLLIWSWLNTIFVVWTAESLLQWTFCYQYTLVSINKHRKSVGPAWIEPERAAVFMFVYIIPYCSVYLTLAVEKDCREEGLWFSLTPSEQTKAKHESVSQLVPCVLFTGGFKIKGFERYIQSEECRQVGCFETMLQSVILKC